MRLKYEPTSVPQHISEKWLFLRQDCVEDVDDDVIVMTNAPYAIAPHHHDTR